MKSFPFHHNKGVFVAVHRNKINTVIKSTFQSITWLNCFEMRPLFNEQRQNYVTDTSLRSMAEKQNVCVVATRRFHWLYGLGAAFHWLDYTHPLYAIQMCNGGQIV